MTQHPHDALFKASLTPGAARALCRAVLPTELGASLEAAELSPQPVSFVEEALRELRSDVCYSARVDGSETLLYVLFEHQSTVDPLMAFRVLRYTVELWSWWLKRQPGTPTRLPLIVPIVVYHGERAWNAARDLAELVDVPPSLAGTELEFVPRFRYGFDDLTRRSDEELRARQAPPFAAVAWIFFRHAYDPDRGIKVWQANRDLLRALLQQAEWASSLEKLVSYSLVRGLGSPDELRLELRRLGGPEAEEVAVTAGERLLEQGRREGLEQGLEQGLLEGERRVLRLQLCKRFALATLPADTERKLQAATQAELETWSERLLGATALGDVFGA